MTEQQEFCLRWNDFHSNFHLSLDSLRSDESFTDVTLSCSGRLIRAHRVILSACSVHFKEILRGIPAQQHPVIVLPTVDYDVMQAIMDFIYQGQVNVKRNQLGAFLQVAETFSIQGLADEDTRKNANKAAGRPRAPPDTDPPSAKRRRAEAPQPGSSPAKTTASPASSAHAAASDSQLPASVEEQEQSAEGAEAESQKTVNISVAIKSEGLADAMVGELLDPAAGGEMLDPDMESGSDVVAQAMATIDTPAKRYSRGGRTSSSFAWQQFSRLDPETGVAADGAARSMFDCPGWAEFGACRQLTHAPVQGRCVRCLKNTRRQCVNCGARLHANCFADYHRMQVLLWQRALQAPGAQLGSDWLDAPAQM